MKTITTKASVRKTDSSLDAALNPVELSSKEIVSWGMAFPRAVPRPEGAGTPLRTPMWRTDATVGTMLAVAGRLDG